MICPLTNALRLDLPIACPPMPRPRVFGKRTVSGNKSTNAFERLVALEAKRHFPEPWRGRIQLVIAANYKDKRRRDLDNITKTVMDSLTRAGVWADDSQVDVLMVSREIGAGEDRVSITVQEIHNIEKEATK